MTAARIAVFILIATPLLAQDIYSIYRADTPLRIDGQLDEAAWTAAPDVGPFVFPWWQEGEREQTVAKLLWDDQYLYALFINEDAHIWAVHTQRDSAVYRDDCVEVFTAPNPARPEAYFNIEMNALGIFLDQYHPDGPGVSHPPWDAEGVRIATSIVGTLNDESDEDHYWVLEAAIPLRNFGASGAPIPPRPGDVWHLNLNRLGGKTNAQYSQWRASQTERPQFHSPRDFGRVVFSDKRSPFWRD